ncbi:hypothetical protein PCE1_004610 [Barthelona sp. PCE]
MLSTRNEMEYIPEETLNHDMEEIMFSQTNIGNLENFSGIYPNCKVLVVDRSFISDVSSTFLHSFPNLEMLTLFANSITSIKFDFVPESLKTVDLASNEICDIEFPENNITKLLLSHNKLRSFDFLHMFPKLERLTVSYNRIVADLNTKPICMEYLHTFYCFDSFNFRFRQSDMVEYIREMCPNLAKCTLNSSNMERDVEYNDLLPTFQEIDSASVKPREERRRTKNVKPTLATPNAGIGPPPSALGNPVYESLRYLITEPLFLLNNLVMTRSTHNILYEARKQWKFFDPRLANALMYLSSIVYLPPFSTLWMLEQSRFGLKNVNIYHVKNTHVFFATAEIDDVYVVAFRGTDPSDKMNVRTNFDYVQTALDCDSVPGAKFHNGYVRNYELCAAKLWEDLLDRNAGRSYTEDNNVCIVDIDQNIHPEKPCYEQSMRFIPDSLPIFRFRTVLCTGHSAGGAYASLCAMHLSRIFILNRFRASSHQEFFSSFLHSFAPDGTDVSALDKTPPPFHAKIPPDDMPLVVCYTFGQPRIGNKNACKVMNHIIPVYFRVVNVGDIVPSLPTNAMGYRSCGVKIITAHNHPELFEVRYPNGTKFIGFDNSTLIHEFLNVNDLQHRLCPFKRRRRLGLPILQPKTSFWKRMYAPPLIAHRHYVGIRLPRRNRKSNIKVSSLYFVNEVQSRRLLSDKEEEE